MHKFTRSFLTEWRKLKLPFDDETFIVAVSGGADSVSLLLAADELRQAKKLNLNFIAAHFNHDLRGDESEQDAQFVEDLAKRLEIEFVLGKAENLSATGENLEQAARKARYKFLFEVAEKHQAFGVLTAHTLNDQAETFLMNLIRGSGSGGLGAIKAVRRLNENSETRLIRPLLNWAKRQDTENFALEKKIYFRTDSMNDNENFARVRVRKTLIPLLAEFNPKIVETLAQTAKLLQEDLEEQTTGDWQMAENLSLKDLNLLSKSTLYKVLRNWLANNRGDLRQIELKHIEAIERLIFSRKSGRLIELPNGGNIIKKQGKLVFEKSKVEKS